MLVQLISVVASYAFTEYDSYNPGTIYSTEGLVSSPFTLGTSGSAAQVVAGPLQNLQYLPSGSGYITPTNIFYLDFGEEITITAIPEDNFSSLIDRIFKR